MERSAGCGGNRERVSGERSGVGHDHRLHRESRLQRHALCTDMMPLTRARRIRNIDRVLRSMRVNRKVTVPVGSLVIDFSLGPSSAPTLQAGSLTIHTPRARWDHRNLLSGVQKARLERAEIGELPRIYLLGTRVNNE
jgi:hypothetical protein